MPPPLGKNSYLSQHFFSEVFPKPLFYGIPKESLLLREQEENAQEDEDIRDPLQVQVRVTAQYVGPDI